MALQNARHVGLLLYAAYRNVHNITTYATCTTCAVCTSPIGGFVPECCVQGCAQHAEEDRGSGGGFADFGKERLAPCNLAMTCLLPKAFYAPGESLVLA
eukprot:scaffold57943_cov28-Tisochrysis_lutea.AAC.2